MCHDFSKYIRFYSFFLSGKYSIFMPEEEKASSCHFAIIFQTAIPIQIVRCGPCVEKKSLKAIII